MREGEEKKMFEKEEKEERKENDRDGERKSKGGKGRGNGKEEKRRKGPRKCVDEEKEVGCDEGDARETVRET